MVTGKVGEGAHLMAAVDGQGWVGQSHIWRVGEAPVDCLESI